MIEYISLFFIAAYMIYLVKTMIKPKKFPPGPRWYPFIGSGKKVNSMSKNYDSQFREFLELSKEYSTNILGLNFGGQLVVVFYGEENFRKILTMEEFEGRPDDFFIRMRCLGMRAGITLVDGPLWKMHRKFTVKHLRSAGIGKGPMEQNIQSAAQDLVDFLDTKCDQPLWPNQFMPLAVLNVLWKCAAGEKIKPEKWNYLQVLLQKRQKTFSLAGGILNRVPWARYLFPGYTGYSMLVEVNRQISQIIEETILKHKKKEVGEYDFIYAFLEKMDENRETFTDDQLKVVCIDLILAGSGTTSNTMEFALLQALRDQDMQGKIQQEIDLVLGDEVPCWSDRNRLIYTSAYLLELQRFYNITPLVGPRRALKETVVDGYVIPKNTTVLVSMRDITMDPNIWTDPRVFSPDRFIDESGNLKQSEHLLTFGLGRRRCPGDALARMFIFTCFTTLMQKYTITCAGDQLPSNEMDIGLLSSAKPYRAVFTPRKAKKNYRNL